MKARSSIWSASSSTPYQASDRLGIIKTQSTMKEANKRLRSTGWRPTRSGCQATSMKAGQIRLGVGSLNVWTGHDERSVPLWPLDEPSQPE